MLQMVLDGVGYAIECINICQFIYEEASQMGVLGVGNCISQKDASGAQKIFSGPLTYAVAGLWKFGMYYGTKFPPVWLAFCYYWYAMKRQMMFYGGEIEQGIQVKLDESAGDKEWSWKEECEKYILFVNSMTTTQEERDQAMAQDNPCKTFYNKYYNHHSPDDYDEFTIACNHFYESQEDKWWTTLDDILTRCEAYTTDEQLSIYAGNPTVTTKAGPTSKQKRALVGDYWARFNIFQKLAYKNQPGGSSYYGFNKLWHVLWDGDISMAGSYIMPHWGFIQFGQGPIEENKSYYTMDNKKTYRVSQSSVIVDSYSWDKGNGTLDPVALIDLQTGRVLFLKDVDGEIKASYTCGSKDLYLRDLCQDPRKGEIYYIQHIPIRWRTIYLKAEWDYVECIAINPLWSLLEVRYPDEFIGGANLYFDTYIPVQDVKVKVIRESDYATIWEETTTADGTIRLGIADENGPVTIKITLPDETVHYYTHLKPEEACINRYYDITNMPEDDN